MVRITINDETDYIEVTASENNTRTSTRVYKMILKNINKVD